MEERLVAALVADTTKDALKWASAVWDGRAADASAFRDRVAAAMFAGMVASAGFPKVRYDEPLPWRVEGSPEFSTVFEELIRSLVSRAPTLSVLSSKALEPALRQTAWFVSGVTSGKILDAMRDEMVRVRMEGGTQVDFIHRVHGLVEKSGPELETVFRTNIRTAAGAGRKAQLFDLEVADLYPAFIYHNPKDERARPLHAAMNGFIALRDDPVWAVVWTPNGYNCRCSIRGATRSEVEGAGLLDEHGGVKKGRHYANSLQESVVKLAESGGSLTAGGQTMSFPDEGFRGNALAGFLI